MVNYLWFLLIVSGIVFSLATGNISDINKEILNSGNKTMQILTITIPLLIMWTGLLKIAQKAGLLKILSNKMKLLLKPLFPKLRSDKALEYIASNVIANMFGLGSAATPFGLKAMEEMQKENPKPNEATSSMITFLVLNTSGVTIIPTTVISLRLLHGSIKPSIIIITSLIATSLASIVGLSIDYLIRKNNNDH